MTDPKVVNLVLMENAQLALLVDRLINAGLTRWHSTLDPSVDELKTLPEWLELSQEEYSAWVENGVGGLVRHHLKRIQVEAQKL